VFERSSGDRKDFREMSASKKSRSLFAQMRDKQRHEDIAQIRNKQRHDDAVPSAALLDEEAMRAVERCRDGLCDSGERQFVSIDFFEAMQFAAFGLNIDFASVVAPHFGCLDDYDRCIYTWRGSLGTWVQLMFDEMSRAMLTLVGVPQIDKLVGSFVYEVSTERGALRLRDVGAYGEVLIQPIVDSSDVLLCIPERKVQLVLTNETPQRLRLTPPGSVE